MPNIRIDIDQKGIQRYSEMIYDPGSMEFSLDARDVKREWVDNENGNSPDLTVAQAETLGDFLYDGVVLEIDESGNVTIVRE